MAGFPYPVCARSASTAPLVWLRLSTGGVFTVGLPLVIAVWAALRIREGAMVAPDDRSNLEGGHLLRSRCLLLVDAGRWATRSASGPAADGASVWFWVVSTRSSPTCALAPPR